MVSANVPALSRLARQNSQVTVSGGLGVDRLLEAELCRRDIWGISTTQPNSREARRWSGAAREARRDATEVPRASCNAATIDSPLTIAPGRRSQLDRTILTRSASVRPSCRVQKMGMVSGRVSPRAASPRQARLIGAFASTRECRKQGLTLTEPYESTKTESGSATPMAYESWTRQRSARPAATSDLAYRRAFNQYTRHAAISGVC